MSRSVEVLLALVVLATSVSAFYEQANSPVRSLTPETFDQVTSSDDLWIVEFYAPWCGHCKSLTPEWEKAAKALKGTGITLAAVDADQYKELGSKYKVNGFPTIKVFGFDKTNPTDYAGGRKADDIVRVAKKEANKLTVRRETGKDPEDEPVKSEMYGSSDVVDLDDANFEKLVLQGKEAWLVEFYAPWCGHCKNMAGDWRRAATQLAGSIKIGAMDATASTIYPTKYGVKGFPTIKFFAPGSSTPEDYEGARTTEAFVAYGQKKAELYPGAPVTVPQFSKQEEVAACLKKLVCVVFVLPHVVDTGVAGRNEYLTTINDVATKLRARSAAFGWVVGGDHSELEETFGLVANYPTWVAMNDKKMLAATHKGRFEVGTITAALTRVLEGRAGTSKFAAVPKLEPGVPLWDGKEYVEPSDEE